MKREERNDEVEEVVDSLVVILQAFSEERERESCIKKLD